MNRNDRFSRLFRYGATFIVVSAAILSGLALWNDYMNSSWTRDGRVRADVVMVAADVSGTVSDVFVSDNQFVKEGEPLFQIDKERFLHAFEEAEAFLEVKKSEYEMRRNQYLRRAQMSSTVLAKEDKDNSELEYKAAKARYEEALVRVQSAKLDIERSSVKALSSGWVSNLVLRKGDYVKEGESRLAIVGQDSFWVYGYFEEHKLPFIHVGDEAEMKMLGSGYILKGHVQSIARGISDRDNTTGERLLANVNPTFTWVRLAQRIPVRIRIDSMPEEFTLVAGMTCSVSVKSTH